MSTSTASKSLGDYINEATADQHASLEDIVMTHFRKSLSPAASTPLLYAKGLSYFLVIFCKLDLALSSNPVLYDARLQRTPGLNADISHINEDFQEVGDKKPKFEVQEWTPELKDFNKSLGDRMHGKPHLLLAHAWVFYLAIFSGGRYMKASLDTSFQSAWLPRLEDDEQRRIPDDYLQFWTFGSSIEESEEIRSFFKKSFEEVAKTLSTEQREEIVVEAGIIMDRLAGIVQELEGLLEQHSEGA